jgi:hypothetical protein
MTTEQLKEAKKFKRDSGIFAVIFWFVSGFLFYQADTRFIEFECLISIGAIVLTFIFFNMSGMIKQYENLRDGK